MYHNIKIIQCAYGHTGSTVLTNILYGFFTPDKYVQALYIDDFYKVIEDTTIIKTHDLDLNKIINKYNKYDFYYILSKRNREYNDEIINNKKALIINYNELLETDENCLDKLIENIYYKLKSFLPSIMFYNDKEQIKNAINRITNMNKRYEEIKNEPFSFYDPFYHLHGSHRNRKDPIN